MVRVLLILALIAPLGWLAPAPRAFAQAETCGPGAVETGRTETNGEVTLTCKCAKGYKPQGGACVFIPPLVERMYPPMTSFVIRGVQVRGEAWLLLRDGRRIDARDAAGVAIDNGAVLTTGPKSRAVLEFPNGTALTVGASSEMAIEKFFYDPDAPPQPYVLKLMFGVIDLIEKPIRQKERRDRANLESQIKRGIIKLEVIAIGIRGTDVQVSVARDGSGYVKLRSGEVDLTPTGSNHATILKPGQMVGLARSGIVGQPRPIPK